MTASDGPTPSTRSCSLCDPVIVALTAPLRRRAPQALDGIADGLPKTEERICAASALQLPDGTMRRRSRMLLESPGVRRLTGSSNGPTLSIRAHLALAARLLNATLNRCLWLQSLPDSVVGREPSLAQA